MHPTRIPRALGGNGAHIIPDPLSSFEMGIMLNTLNVCRQKGPGLFYLIIELGSSQASSNTAQILEACG